jgi:DUF971 family protein
MSCLSPLFVPPVPRKLQLKRTESLRIEWSDGVLTTYPLDYLRSMCPCATCRSIRETPKPPPGKSLSLKVLPGNFQSSTEVKGAELVGNYAIRIDWSDGHDSGIYSFEYLRQIGASLTDA